MTERAFHAGLTSEAVVEAAADLTRESSLWQWSMRDLARRLEVAPSVLYHHVGGKDALARRVVQVAFVGLPTPDPELEWQEWFRRALAEIRVRLERYPGVAKWLMMHGPTFEAATEYVDVGVAVLRRGGFGELTGVAYALVFNGVIGTVALADERLEHDADGPRDHAAITADAADLAAKSPGMAALRDAVMEPFVHDLAGERDQYHHLLIETLLAGVAAVRDRARES